MWPGLWVLYIYGLYDYTHIQTWAGPKANLKLSINWEDDKSNSLEYLATLLNPKFEFKMEPKEGGGIAKAVGSTYRREYATAIASGPYARYFGGGTVTGAASTWDIKYEEKGSGWELIQKWTPRVPQYISTDQRPGTRFTLKIKPER